MKILIDADACPKVVLQICLNTGRQKDIPVWTVASFNHEINSDHHIIVGNSSQETDLKVMNLCEAGDIIVTQDIGLAAMVVGKGAKALGPSGKEYRPETMSIMLEERELKAKYRRAGGRTKGPSKRTPMEDRLFEQTLMSLLSEG
ncbi:hypothetical protein Desdi_2219 [Desulfitobacterium dichloroeliminans LMG P-21439]|uniref:UPF0178 protein Desdi_2219 n=1 Tax=Desulfitobacterium dichloroeliminans (strain LMG P-21439 / DCA1) TaxID=871963 RepID=L0F8X8_DESDL|nr:DUF188 domain-containing protein [Desulfitobacterium dichloroeliminans]AGA69652.1 hypothetical protein Desdi_2219 [Desulfitobacterium dichloroeliminans LMG P-21439]